MIQTIAGRCFTILAATAMLMGAQIFLANAVLAQSDKPWEAKNAYARCEGAIAGGIAWPLEALETCRAMHMCANEAPLDEKQLQVLVGQMEQITDCPAL